MSFHPEEPDCGFCNDSGRPLVERAGELVRADRCPECGAGAPAVAAHRVVVRVNPETFNWQARCQDCLWEAGQRADATAEELAEQHRRDTAPAEAVQR